MSVARLILLGMLTWHDFVRAAPRISEIFTRRHAACGNLCMLATVRRDGSPRICPMEPRVFEGELLLIGMPNTTKFTDLRRDPRFCLHTATTDPQVGDGDAKVWGEVVHLPEKELHQRFATALHAETDMDLRGQEFDPFYAARITGASAVEVDNALNITVWKPGESEHMVRKT